MGDRAAISASARTLLETYIGKIVSRSAIYESESWGFQSPLLFWNQALCIETVLSPVEALRAAQRIEALLGRVRGAERYASRTIDIDLLFYESIVLKLPELELPHPRMAERKFVLTPLAEIAPHFVHPVYNKTVSELLNICPDSLFVGKVGSGQDERSEI